MTFGERLRELRMRNHMTQEALAKQISLEKMSISKYESGKMLPSSPTLIALCRVFHVGAEYFFREYTVHLSAVPQFRMKNNSMLSESEQKWIRTQTESAVENLLEIADVCNYERDFSSLESLRETALLAKDMESLSQKIRSAWNLGLDPIENLMESVKTPVFRLFW